MRKGAFALAIAFLAFAVQAVPVTRVQASAAVRAWVNRGETLGVRLGTMTLPAEAHTTTNGAVFYSVKTVAGGTVFTSGDTELEPVIGFTSETNDFTTIDEKSPLWTLLNHDVSAMKVSQGRVYAMASQASVLREKNASANAGKWAALLEEADAIDVSPLFERAFASAIKYDSGISDMRVPALVKSKWSQSNVSGKACYNYYTPNGPDPDEFVPGSSKNAVCGCVATAMSQVMRYFRFPTASVTPKTRTCSWATDDKRKDEQDLVLTMQGGKYDWDNMPLVPAAGVTDEERQAIGKLTSDAGISVWMGYTGESSGAYGAEETTVLKEVWGYKNAVCLQAEAMVGAGSPSRKATLAKTMFANFDAEHPVLVNIPGHAVLADGYGYVKTVDYVHFNMGWAGQSDYWYNIPDLTEAGSSYNAIQEIIYNIFTNAPSTHAILSGRVLNDDGQRVKDAVVTISTNGVAVAELLSSSNGIWYAILPVGVSYDVSATEGGLTETLTGIQLTKPTTKNRLYVNCQVDFVEQSISALGNSWGNDITLLDPTVRVIRDGQTNGYSRLEKALAAIREDGAIVEILEPTELRKSVSVTNQIVLVATNMESSASIVTRSNDAYITIGEGGNLMISNIVFSGSSKILFEIATNGTLTLGADVDFGVGDGVAIQTMDATGFCLAAEIDNPFTLISSSAKKDLGAQFGTYICSDDEAAACASLIENGYEGTEGEIAGVASSGKLVWGEVPVPLERAAGYFVEEGNVTNTSARIDRLFEKLEKSTALPAGEIEVVILKSDALTRSVGVGRALRLVGKDDASISSVGAAGGFQVTNGTLTVENLTISNYTGNALFFVNGGHLVFDEVLLDGIDGTNRWSGALAVLSGSAAVTNSTFNNCRATGIYMSSGRTVSAQGGAIFLLNNACSLDLHDVVITNCWANFYGGGIFVGEGAKIGLGGDVKIVGNTAKSSTSCRRDNIFVYSTNDQLMVTAPLVGGRNVIGLRSGKNIGNAAGFRFAKSLIDTALPTTAENFFNDATDGIEAVVETGLDFAWENVSTDKRVTYLQSVCVVSNCGEDVDGYYKSLEDAFAVLCGEAPCIEITYPAVGFFEDLTVTNQVTLTTADAVGETAEIQRWDDCGFKVTGTGSLTITNVTLCGRGSGRNPIGSKSYLSVDGGALVLQNGASVREVTGDDRRDVGGIAVWNGGSLTLEQGSLVSVCSNAYYKNVADYGVGGGVLLEHATAYLRGGQVKSCSARNGAGIFVGSGSTVYVSGKTVVAGNYTSAGKDNNLIVSENSTLCLDGPLDPSAALAMTSPGITANTNYIGRVEGAWSEDLGQLLGSATNFVNDITKDTGMAVTNAAKEIILVWCSAIVDSVYVAPNGERYYSIVPVNGAQTMPALTLQTRAGVVAALSQFSFADARVSAAILASGDDASAVSAYNDFREWAGKVAGGESAALKSAQAWSSYRLGAEELFTQEPVIEINSAAASNGGLTITLTVKDGEDPHKVASAAVSQLFQASKNLTDWSLGVSVQDLTVGSDSTVSFTVVPGDGSEKTAFIRLKE